MTLDEAIVYSETVARANESLFSNYESDKRRSETYRQLAAYLRELQERRKKDNCSGCMLDDLESVICLTCKRYCKDKYRTERRTDGT